MVALLTTALIVAGMAGASAERPRESSAVKPADVNAVGADGTTPLHWAVYRDDIGAVDRLVRAGAKVNTADRYGVTPLSVACTNGNVTIVDRLLSAGARVDSAAFEGEPALLTCARSGNAAAVRAMLAHGADPNAVESWHHQSALMWAAAADGAAAVQTLVDAGADIWAKSEGGFTALHYAARAGALDATRILIDNGADVSALLDNKSSPLMLALINARYELAAYLLDQGADANDNALGFTPLHQLVWSYHPNVSLEPPGPEQLGSLDAIGMARVLLDHKANPNARMTRNPSDGYRTSMNRIGATPLLTAARVPDVDLMRLLLEYGADPTLTTNDHTNLLMIAAGYGFQAGESPESKPGALVAAVKLALDLGGDINSANDRGYTPLHCAVIRESNELIQFLVDEGADLYAKTKEEDPRFAGVGKGKTPLEVAEGQMVIASFKYYPEQAALLRTLMGIPAIKDLRIVTPNSAAAASR
jgi:ankyrin repeat protein